MSTVSIPANISLATKWHTRTVEANLPKGDTSSETRSQGTQQTEAATTIPISICCALVHFHTQMSE